jgi:hypothetical protein
VNLALLLIGTVPVLINDRADAAIAAGLPACIPDRKTSRSHSADCAPILIGALVTLMKWKTVWE